MAKRDAGPELEFLFSQGVPKHFETGEHLMTEGAPSDYIFDILSGTVAIERNGSSGKRQILKFLNPPDFIGAASTPRYPNLATALTDVTTICYPRGPFDKALRVSPDFSENFRNSLTRMLEASNDHVFIVGQRSSIERIASFLLMLRASQANADHNFVNLPMTRTDIADFLGLTIETVSRAFGSLKGAGIITFSNSHSCRIVRLNQLREIGGRDDFTENRGRI